jgi:hypothetical protein
MWDARLTFKFGHMRPEIWPYSARMAARQVEARQELPIIAGRKRLVRRGTPARSRKQLRPSKSASTSASSASPSASIASVLVDAATQSLGEPAFESRTSRNQGLLAIKDFSQSFCPRGPPGWGRQPEVKWPAAPSLPTTSNCPASSRAMASTDSNRETAPGSIGKTEVGRLYCNCTPQK